MACMLPVHDGGTMSDLIQVPLLLYGLPGML